jgi:hypothetical protein
LPPRGTAFSAEALVQHDPREQGERRAIAAALLRRTRLRGRAQLGLIFPQPHDLPMDLIVTP